MDVSLIVAKSENNVIGCENRLPWRIPEDLKLFRQYTMDKALVMGRKTFESIGKPLPGRLNIVLTRGSHFRAPPGVIVQHCLEDGIDAARSYAAERGQTEIMVIGGAEIFAEALQYCTRIYLSEIPRTISGDAFFPEVNRCEWPTRQHQKIKCEAGDINEFTFTILCKRNSALAAFAVA